MMLSVSNYAMNKFVIINFINAFVLQLCVLPAKPCVVEILEGFTKTFCVNYICEPVEREPVGKDRDKLRSDKNQLRLPAENV